jgi:hypothetical protein
VPSGTEFAVEPFGSVDGVSVITTLMIICPECLEEIEQLIDRAEAGDASAQESLRLERANALKLISEETAADSV